MIASRPIITGCNNLFTDVDQLLIGHTFNNNSVFNKSIKTFVKIGLDLE